MKTHEIAITSNEKRTLVRRLLAWFHVNQRALPWRASRDPYSIWVSEVMLQQTQVTAVIPFFKKFLSRFPTIADLAQAHEQEVLKYWEGLGYYRRARLLHQAAQLIVREHDGAFPSQAADALRLPGLGRYTLGAVLSQAFDQRLPIVDANVARVLCRLFAWTKELEARDTQEWLWNSAERLLPLEQVGDFNQALMELGQTLCTTGQPSCLLCPLRDLCQGHARGLASMLPKRRAKTRHTLVKERAIILRKGKQVLIGQRPCQAARWANMWEFPTSSEPLDAMAQSLKLTGYRCGEVNPLGELQYGITRFKVTLEVIEAGYEGGRQHQQAYQKLVWVKPKQLVDYPLSVPQRKLALRFVVEESPSHR
ncbi:MAG TPA: A/G-specific adenine glycosylase [Gemmatales bacterium]|nr:A/G-specific adenine glycosylase [Gemmatales bacterium]